MFGGNCYIGRYENRPINDVASPTAPPPMSFDEWPGPQFNPRQPETFPAYLQAHREWMLRLMQRQFGRRPPLSEKPQSP